MGIDVKLYLFSLPTPGHRVFGFFGGMTYAIDWCTAGVARDVFRNVETLKHHRIDQTTKRSCHPLLPGVCLRHMMNSGPWRPLLPLDRRLVARLSRLLVLVLALPNVLFPPATTLVCLPSLCLPRKKKLPSPLGG